MQTFSPKGMNQKISDAPGLYLVRCNNVCRYRGDEDNPAEKTLALLLLLALIGIDFTEL